MEDYTELYEKRLDKYGRTYQDRIHGERRRQFELYLKQSLYRIVFPYKGKMIEGVLQKYKQDSDESFQYLLVRESDEIEPGSILEVKYKNHILHWLVYYFDQIQISGYNRYILIRAESYVTWTARNGLKCGAWCYISRSDLNQVDTQKSVSHGAVYLEDMNKYHIYTTLNPNIKKDDYLITGEGEFREYFRVVGYDNLTTPGVSLITADRNYNKDLSLPPDKQPGDSDDEFFWLSGGEDDGST